MQIDLGTCPVVVIDAKTASEAGAWVNRQLAGVVLKNGDTLSVTTEYANGARPWDEFVKPP